MIPAHYAALKDHDEIVELFFTVKPDTMTQVNAVTFVKKNVFAWQAFSCKLANQTEEGDELVLTHSFYSAH